MRPYFTSETQKKNCIHAVEDSLTMWKYILDEMEKGRTVTKLHATDELKVMDPCPLHQVRTIPLNWCFLCQYVMNQTIVETTDEEYEQVRGSYAGAMLCDRFCPIIWNPADNPENQDGKDEFGNDVTPCESKGSPYYDYGCSHGKNTVRNMCLAIEQTLPRIKDMPVEETTHTI